MLNDGRVLDQRDEKKLIAIAEELAEDNEIEACCVYGSKVAGYARDDSDYDILLVLREYDHIIKYLYEKSGFPVSALVVDSNSLLKDAERALLGEFVVGRLLHPYYPMINADYLLGAEKIYKKRVVYEELRELAATDPLYPELLIPVDYFLYSKLRKRARMYPHALYSYVKTYSGEQGSYNLERTRRGFVTVLKELEREGYIRFDKELVQILDGVINPKSGDKTAFKMTNVVRGMFSWLVHTYAGRRTLIFVKEEAKSKLRRRKNKGTRPLEMREPETMLKITEGMRLQSSRWIKDIAIKFGFNNYSVNRKKLGDLHAATTLLTMTEKGRTERFVVKQFASIRAVKWTAVNVWTAGVKKFDADPNTRFRREYTALRKLRTLGLNTPEIIAVVPGKKLLVTRYLECKKLSEIIDEALAAKSTDLSAVRKWGGLLQFLHSNGYTLLDTKASNILVHNNELYLTDLEQFSYDDDKAWDIACFLYYSMKFTTNEEASKKVVRAFLEGYMQNGSIYILKKVLDKKYVSPFYPALVLGIISAIREEVKSFITTICSPSSAAPAS